MLARHDSRVAISHLAALVKDPDAEVRAQVTHVLGDSPQTSPSLFLQMLHDPMPRVRLFALLGLAHATGIDAEAVKAVADTLRENNDQDAYLRHAGVMALTAAADRKLLLDTAKSDSAAVRLGATLALRRLHAPEIADLLGDGDPRVATEAARAIHDESILEALPKLAALLAKPSLPEFLEWRALNANFRLGGQANADLVASFAANASARKSSASRRSKCSVIGLSQPAEIGLPDSRPTSASAERI